MIRVLNFIIEILKKKTGTGRADWETKDNRFGMMGNSEDNVQTKKNT